MRCSSGVLVSLKGAVITLPRRLGTWFLTFVILQSVTGNLFQIIAIISLYLRTMGKIERLYGGRVCGSATIPVTPGERDVCPQISRKFHKSSKYNGSDLTTSANQFRIVGASSQHTQPAVPARYPWLCSLKTRGYR